MQDANQSEGRFSVRLKPVNPADKSALPASIDLPVSAIVLDVKKEIEQTTETPVENQKLIYKGKVLINKKTLESYGRSNSIG